MIGVHAVICATCGKAYLSGDSITFECAECWLARIRPHVLEELRGDATCEDEVEFDPIEMGM